MMINQGEPSSPDNMLAFCQTCSHSPHMASSTAAEDFRWCLQIANVGTHNWS